MIQMWSVLSVYGMLAYTAPQTNPDSQPRSEPAYRDHCPAPFSYFVRQKGDCLRS